MLGPLEWGNNEENVPFVCFNTTSSMVLKVFRFSTTILPYFYTEYIDILSFMGFYTMENIIK